MQSTHHGSHRLYFSYGSNMLESQMLARCPSTMYIGNAALPGYRLVFPICSPKREGMGVASVLESASTDVVEGVVYRIANEDLLRLDQYESLGKQYSREWMLLDIHKTNGTILSAAKVWFYRALADHTQHHPPSFEYLECLIQGAKAHGLSRSYIAKLESIKPENNGKG